MSCPRGGRRRPGTEAPRPWTLEDRHLRLWTGTHFCSLGVCLLRPAFPRVPTGTSRMEAWQEERDPQGKVNPVSRAETRLPGWHPQKIFPQDQPPRVWVSFNRGQVSSQSGGCILLPEDGVALERLIHICSVFCGVTCCITLARPCDLFYLSFLSCNGEKNYPTILWAVNVGSGEIIGS